MGCVCATITVVLNTHKTCDICVDFIFKHMTEICGAQSIVKEAKQLKVKMKRHSCKIRSNTNYYKPRKMTAVLRVNGKHSAAEVEKVLWPYPGMKHVAMLDKKRTKVQVRGSFAINSVCEKLEKKLGAYVTVCSVEIDAGIIFDKYCLNPLKMLGTCQTIRDVVRGL